MSDDLEARTRRYREWTTRSMGLGWGTELWADPSVHPDWEYWKALVRARKPNREPGASDLGVEMTSSLIRDFLFAGGGVEAEHHRFADAFEAAQEWATRAFTSPPPDMERAPGFRHMVGGGPCLHEAHWAFANLLTWARAVEDRIDRRHLESQSRVGIAPALREGTELRREVEKAIADYRHQVPDLRWLTNYALHAGFIPGGGTPSAEVDDEGRIHLRLPDAPENPRESIRTWHQFNYTQGRDMRRYADDTLAAVEEVVDAVLTAFERHQPARFRWARE